MTTPNERCMHGVPLYAWCTSCETDADRMATLDDERPGHVTPVGCWLLTIAAVVAGIAFCVYAWLNRGAA